MSKQKKFLRCKFCAEDLPLTKTWRSAVTSHYRQHFYDWRKLESKAAYHIREQKFKLITKEIKE